jgi:hypothetical protein
MSRLSNPRGNGLTIMQCRVNTTLKMADPRSSRNFSKLGESNSVMTGLLCPR